MTKNKDIKKRLDAEKPVAAIRPVTYDDVKTKMIALRNQYVLLDRDVAELYGVETRQINQAVKLNPQKFLPGYVFSIENQEVDDLRSKNLITISSMSRVNPTAFTERGLYMLATILKGEQATQTTISIIETYAQVRELARTMEALQTVTDGGEQQQTLLQKTGEILATVVGNNLSTESTETEIELNFAVVKIKHKVIKKK